MKFYRHLYASGSLVKKKDKIIRKLKSGKYPLGTYILVLPETGPNQLEFFSTALLRQRRMDGNKLFVVGLASGYDDAVYLVEDIVRQIYEDTGNTDIRSYIREQEGWEN